MIKIKNQKGFTLLELIVVITIISILSLAVGQNILNKVGSSRATAHVSNIEVIENAASLYLADNATLEYGFVDDTNVLITDGHIKTRGVIENPWKDVDDATKASYKYAIINAGNQGVRAFLVDPATTIDAVTGAVTSGSGNISYIDRDGVMQTIADGNGIDPTVLNIN